MTDANRDLNLVFITGKPNHAVFLQSLMLESGVTGVIRRMSPDQHAVNCSLTKGVYKKRSLPDLFLFDYSVPDKRNTAILKQIAFGDSKTSVPVVVLTSPASQAKLDGGAIDGGNAVMFSPTSLTSFVRKLRHEGRKSFFKALNTLYEYGPILVRAPAEILVDGSQIRAVSA